MVFLCRRECKSGHALRHDQLKRGKIMAAIHKGVWCRGILNDVLRDDVSSLFYSDICSAIVFFKRLGSRHIHKEIRIQKCVYMVATRFCE